MCTLMTSTWLVFLAGLNISNILPGSTFTMRFIFHTASHLILWYTCVPLACSLTEEGFIFRNAHIWILRKDLHITVWRMWCVMFYTFYTPWETILQELEGVLSCWKTCFTNSFFAIVYESLIMIFQMWSVHVNHVSPDNSLKNKKLRVFRLTFVVQWYSIHWNTV
jgi:hypothetical protein